MLFILIVYKYLPSIFEITVRTWPETYQEPHQPLEKESACCYYICFTLILSRCLSISSAKS